MIQTMMLSSKMTKQFTNLFILFGGFLLLLIFFFYSPPTASAGFCADSNVETCTYPGDSCIACPFSPDQASECSATGKWACCNGTPSGGYNANTTCDCQVYDCGGGGGSCKCDAVCVGPKTGVLNFTTPVDASLVINSTINWTDMNGSDWGADSVESACSGDKCHMTQYGGNGYYKLFAEISGSTINVTDYCKESIGGGNNAYIPESTASKCTITRYDPSLMGKTIKFTIKAYNSGGDSCAPVQASRNFKFPANDKPQCSLLYLNSDSSNGSIVNSQYPNSKFMNARTSRDFKIHFNVEAKDDPIYGDSKLQVCYSIANQKAEFYQQGQLAWKCIDPAVNKPSNTVTVNAGPIPDKSIQQLVDEYIGYMNSPAKVPSNPEGPQIPRITQISSLLSSNDPLKDIIETKGLVVNTNVFDNFYKSSICSSNLGFNGGDGYYLPFPPDPTTDRTCNSYQCVLYLHNQSPEITYMAPSDPVLPWVVGSYAEEIPTNQCQDNNPYTAQLHIRDADGSKDIDNIEYNIAQTWAVDPTKNQANNWPMRALFSLYGGTDNFTNENKNYWETPVFALRDADPLNGNRCFKKSGSTYVEAFKTVDNDYLNCYRMPDKHNWESAISLSGQKLGDGKTYTIYYLPRTIESWADGRMVRMRGNANWRLASYIAYESSGNNVKANFIIEMAPDGGTKWHGTYKGVWQVQDYFGLKGLSIGVDKKADIPGEIILNPNGKAYHQRGTLKIDLTPPTYTKKESSFADEAQTTLKFAWSLTDTMTRVRSASGHLLFEPTPDPLDGKHVIDTTAITALDAGIRSPYLPYPGKDYLGSLPLWNKKITYTIAEKTVPNTETRTEIIDVSQIGAAGTYTFDLFGSDAACNVYNAATETEVDPPPPPPPPPEEKNWMTTQGGFVYSDDGVSVQYPTFDPPKKLSTDLPGKFKDYDTNMIGFSTEWYGTNEANVELSSIPNKTTTGIFISGKTGASSLSYYDLNRNLDVHSDFEFALLELRGLPEFENDYEYAEDSKSTYTLPGNLGSLCLDSNAICIADITASSQVNISSTFTCDRKALIMLETPMLNIEKTIVLSDPNDESIGCIFVASGDVKIGKLDDQGSTADVVKYDQLSTFIVSNGDITIPNETPVDGLYVKGSLISTQGTISFDREIKNDEFPSLLMEYDLRYLKIYRDIFRDVQNDYKRELGF